MNQNSLNKYIQIIGKKNCLLPDSEQFQDFLHDETYLKGSAELVLFPDNHEKVKQVVNLSLKLSQEDSQNKNDYKITVRGLGSGLAGAAVPQEGIVLSLEKLNNFYKLDIENMRLHVDAGVITSAIHSYLAPKKLTYLPDPSSANVSSIGGNIATNAAGPKSFKYGPTRNYISKIRVVWADGSDDWVGSYSTKSSVGFSLKDLLIGSEGRLGIITEVILKVNALSEYSAIVLVSFDNYIEAAQTIVRISQSSLDVSAVEFIDERSILVTKEMWPQNMQNKKALLLMELEGSEEYVFSELERVGELLENKDILLATDEKRKRSIWDARKKVSENLKNKKKIKIGEDVSIPISNLPDIINYSYKLGDHYNIYTVIWGHAGDGNLHVNMLLDEENEIEKSKKMLDDLIQYVLSIQGSISGEHGLGLIKRNYITNEQGENLVHKQEQLARIFDPEQILNNHLNQ